MAFPVISFIHSYYVDGQLPAYVYVIDIILTIVLAEISYHYIETPFRKQGIRTFSISRGNKQAVIRSIVLILFLLPAIFVFVGSFDKLGKNDINHKATSYNTNEIDKYLVRPIPVDDVNF